MSAAMDDTESGFVFETCQEAFDHYRTSDKKVSDFGAWKKTVVMMGKQLEFVDQSVTELAPLFFEWYAQLLALNKKHDITQTRQRVLRNYFELPFCAIVARKQNLLEAYEGSGVIFTAEEIQTLTTSARLQTGRWDQAEAARIEKLKLHWAQHATEMIAALSPDECDRFLWARRCDELGVAAHMHAAWSRAVEMVAAGNPEHAAEFQRLVGAFDVQAGLPECLREATADMYRERLAKIHEACGCAPRPPAPGAERPVAHIAFFGLLFTAVHARRVKSGYMLPKRVPEVRASEQRV